MASLSTKLYASQENGGSPTVSVNDLVPLVGGAITIPAAGVSTRGGVLLGAGVTASSATVPSNAPAGGTGTAAGAWDTSADRDAAIATINALVTLTSELKTKVNALISSLSASGSIAGG